ncbi:MAG: hypothetical protein AB7I01_01855 [Gammaproteobacteria bacterium]
MRTTLLATAAALLLCQGAAQADPATDNPKDAAGPGMGHRHHAGGPDAGERHRCMHKGMVGGPMMPRMIALPSLPPGNAKLEMQMQAEIMQKVGEIIGKYANQVKEQGIPGQSP